ncbi:(E3-independent) E2 ubiquitin-conjugating enzyme UBE2O [Drosophila rhopaloa]|uniref:(E3-independent) E2 ubiquitin-conjugating enzyme UBE2O n=1 Tax=Drosophila rhopaloa TaxID=1041015 RepID=A0A6P4EMW5_DRORH|nr:(E3-independent) E2 ubiquitin-conjugating enzyme UBE2O [Drosophila rhopaloa]XP_016977944.1 (E3-independent) E2 ubiquitin-conjugating enzyme UBE2O [Drosophila rhopaloa]XP_016977945.1 (E3-independent) E2 ubiquitin-conjugating enzyme UBE2O [Drosophila rhopaloa]
MLSDVAGAAGPGGAPDFEQDSEEVSPLTLPAEDPPAAQDQVKTPGSQDHRHSGAHSRRTGGGQVPSRNQGGNNECQFFFEDEVFRIDRRGRVHFGVVTETAESYSSDEDEEVDEVLSKGEVRVAFYPDGKELVHTEHSIGLADRTLMPGDVVRRRLPGQKDLIGQAGYVRDVNVRADVTVLGSKLVIKNVAAERLRPISEWTRDVPVCLGTWIGTTVNVDECAVIKNTNGARLEITSNDFHKFKDAVGHCAREVFNPNVYFPGNVVIGRLPPPDRVKNLTPEIDLPANRKARAMYTVESIRTTSVNVAWTCRAISQFENGTDIDPLKQPKTTIKGEDLNSVKRLNIYESYVLQIHDRFYLKYSKCDLLIRYTDWEEEQAEKYIPIYNSQKKMDKGSKLNSSASSSGNARNVPKFRRLANKFSGMRLPRPASDHTHSSNASKVSKRSEEVCSSGEDEEEEDEEPIQLPEPSVAPEKEAAVAEDAESPSPDSTAAADAAAQAPRITMRHAKRRHVKKKMRSVKKLITAPFARKDLTPKDGDEIVVETLVVYSSVTVVWQDGTVETGILSTQLYPIHHLDNHEFFPGDFVSKANENSTGVTDYGVIQCVDHDERIAKVLWFNIYSHVDNPIPLCKDLEELSVYDLKDHSDYQYRPGTMVIRVSNFTGEDVDSTAGQVIDNYPDGRVRVWWAKGHITMCYPQDLFEINHNDQDQDAYESDGSEDSWETQSENSRVGMNLSLSSMDNEEHIIMGIDRATEAMKRLEKLFRILPPKRKPEVLNDLLAVYKNCRSLDRMLKTNFFHEDHFQNIVQCKPSTDDDSPDLPTLESVEEASPDALTVLPKVSSTIKLELESINQSCPGQPTLTPTKRKSSTEMDEVQCKKSADKIAEEADAEEEEDALELDKVTLTESETKLDYNQLVKKYRSEYTELFGCARNSIAKAFENRTKNDSGVHSRGENTSDEFNNPDSDNKSVEVSEVNDDKMKCKEDCIIELLKYDADVCEVFCFLIKEQMAKCREAVVETVSKPKGDRKDEDEEVSDAEEAIEPVDQDRKPAEDGEDRQIAEDDAMEQPLNLNALSESLPPIDSPMACSSPSCSVIPDTPPVCDNCFQVMPNAPAAHHFIGSQVTPANKSQYQRAVQREYRMLQASLPAGVVVRAYEDRMDLISVMMVGPQHTPYQNALFFFDFQLGRDYPKSPPVCHYISYCTERLNPNLYEEGKVCVSLLGTWSGRDTEVWSYGSTMLQVLVSIQGLILVDEPYYNEAGYEKQKGTQLGNENSRVYNEMAIIKIAHSTVKQLQNPPLVFRSELIEHFKEFGCELHGRMQAWSEYSAEAQRQRITSIKDMPVEYKAPCELPEFPLLPCSRGFCIAVKGVLGQLQSELTALGTSLATGDRNGIPAGTGTAPRAAPEEI